MTERSADVLRLAYTTIDKIRKIWVLIRDLEPHNVRFTAGSPRFGLLSWDSGTVSVVLCRKAKMQPLFCNGLESL